MITNVKGDLIKMFKNGAFDAIVHGCNCFHTMGAGIAGQIAEQFPQALEADKLGLYGDIDKLGRYTIAQADKGFIINGYTQYRPGQEERPRLYSSISTLFDNLSNDLADGSKIGIPWIGSGIAGGDWEVIEELIRVRTANMKVFAVEYVPSHSFKKNDSMGGVTRSSAVKKSNVVVPRSESGLSSWMD